MSDRPQLGDVFASFVSNQNKWVVYQVVQWKAAEKNSCVGEMQDTIAIMALDWWSENLPTTSELISLKPLVVNHHNWKDHYDVRYVVNPTPPKNFQMIGNVSYIQNIEINTYGDWPSRHNIAGQYEWLEYAEQDRIAYKSALKSDKKVWLFGKEVRESSTNIYLDETDFANWSDLKKLPALYEINYTGSDLKLLEACASVTFFSKLSWKNHLQSKLDFTGLNFKELVLDVTGLDELVIPDSLRFLSFTGDYKFLAGLKVKQENQGKSLHLHLHGLKEFSLPKVNLNQLKKLSMHVTSLDMKLVANYYPNISELYIWGNPGFVHHFNEIKNLPYLSDIQFNEVFGYTEIDFPSPKDFPLLDRIWLTSVPEEAGKYVKKHFRHISDLSVSKLRNKTWLDVNLDNPFRTWDGREGTSASKAKKAFDAYKNACAQIDKMKKSASTEEQEKKIIADFVEIFNKMDAKGGIDTLEREEIFDVFNLLQEKMNLSRDTYAEYFDELRDF